MRLAHLKHKLFICRGRGGGEFPKCFNFSKLSALMLRLSHHWKVLESVEGYNKRLCFLKKVIINAVKVT